MFNKDITGYVQQCGFLSEPIVIGRGCRQGDPISSYLFIICAQILQSMTQNNKNIKGIKINNTEIKLTQFADDTTILLDGSKDSLQASLNTLEIFGTLSGLKVNVEKTQIVWIGKKRQCKDKLDVSKELVWGNETFNLLGINFSVNLDDIKKLNYDPSIDKITKSLCTWRKRYFTPLGKITVLKTLIVSKLTHLFTALPNPDQCTIQKLQQLFFKFIWDNKPDKINRTRICSDYIQGGLRMFDLDSFISSLKCTWIRRLLKQESSPWYELCIYNIQSYDKCFNMNSLWHKKVATETTNMFWKDTLMAWSRVLEKLTKNENQQYVPNSSLWYNPLLSKNPIFYPEWYRKGIIFIGDIFHNGSLLSIDDLKSCFNIKTNFLEYPHRTIIKENKLL